MTRVKHNQLIYTLRLASLKAAAGLPVAPTSVSRVTSREGADLSRLSTFSTPECFQKGGLNHGY